MQRPVLTSRTHRNQTYRATSPKYKLTNHTPTATSRTLIVGWENRIMTELLDAIADYMNHVWMNLTFRLGREPDARQASTRVQPMEGAVRYWFGEIEDSPAWRRLIK